jgi:ferredoxin-type protein NapH
MMREQVYMKGSAENAISQSVKISPIKELESARQSRFIKQAAFGTVFIALVVAGWFYSLIGYFIPLCMVAGVGLASVRGRTWCNWMCPRGSFADTYMKVISPGKDIPPALRKFPVRLGVIAFLMAMLTFQIVRLWPDPFAIGRFFVVLLTITTIIGIFLATFIHQRVWCSICPIGSLSSWAGVNRRPLQMDRDSCVSCGLCAKNCPMQLKPNALKDQLTMEFKGDCLKCELCVKGCPKQALKF